MNPAQQRLEIRRYLAAFDFSGLFTDSTVGWDWPDTSGKLLVPFIDTTGDTFKSLEVVAEKRGVKVLHVPSGADGLIPTADQRRKLEKAVTPLAAEHLLIFTDAAKTRQIWLWTSRLSGKPVSHRELSWEKDKSNELLLQKLSSIAFTLDEEEALDITGVVQKMQDTFSRDTVTKRFYEQFKTQKDAFRGFIQGLTDGGLLDWYTSLMLNRLMFCYFLQRKGFLNGEDKYLRNRLDQVRDELGDGQFHTFYKSFLRRLFHEGLGQPENERDDALKTLIGKVPYLNGGIFEEHRIEREHPALEIPDEAFDRVFTFLDKFDWHLDERPIATGREINPEILGYVFEKYTNQKEMGAYYTKEDITDYIAKNCLIPFLLDATSDKLSDASWKLLRDQPTRYIYSAVGHGVFCDYPSGKTLSAPLPLPEYIEIGIDPAAPDLRQRRARWNEAATLALGLPTEIWRETVARRQRCTELQSALRNPQSAFSVNDLITLNLDIRQFAQDVVENADPALLLALSKAIRKISVLDPTCGSGAFLFAALNILEPLYRASLERMRSLLGDWEARDDRSHPVYRKAFADVLAQAARHPNENYFIFKSIIVHNLYGVDIMEEAVEICKLRLFLKLAAQLEPGQEIEPLPDIDFNIRAGNTLVGYSSRDEVRRAVSDDKSIRHEGDGTVQGKLLGIETTTDAYAAFQEAAENVNKAFQLFQQMQDEFGLSAADFRNAKRDLTGRLQTLRDQLDRFLATDYDKRNLASDTTFQKWRTSHQPFHWFVEFYGILNRGGFDAIIGNPPYVSTSKVAYLTGELKGMKFPDIYALVLLRSLSLSSKSGRCGMIVPLSVTFSSEFGLLRTRLCAAGAAWFSSYDNIPAAIFDGVSQRCTIWIGGKGGRNCFSTPMYRWRSAFRQHLVDSLAYVLAEAKNTAVNGLPKLYSLETTKVLAAIHSPSIKLQRHIITAGRIREYPLSFSQAARNFISVFREAPPYLDASTLRTVPSSKIGYVSCNSDSEASGALVSLAGELYFYYWLIRGDGFDVTSWIIKDYLYCLDFLPQRDFARIVALGELLHERRFESLVFKKNAGKYVGNFNFQSQLSITRRADLLILAGLGLGRKEALDVFDRVQRVLAINESAGEKSIPYAVKSKFLPKEVDATKQSKLFREIDTVLAEHYGFTAEELDFIINYDIKYRLGLGSQGLAEETLD